MLDVLPIGVLVFPGSGISANLADKVRKMGIPSGSSQRAARERRHLSTATEAQSVAPLMSVIQIWATTPEDSKRWLPAVLRTPEPPAGTAEPGAQSESADAAAIHRAAE